MTIQTSFKDDIKTILFICRGWQSKYPALTQSCEGSVWGRLGWWGSQEQEPGHRRREPPGNISVSKWMIKLVDSQGTTITLLDDQMCFVRISYYLWLGLITAEIWNPPREGIGVHSQRTPSLPLFGFTVMENFFSSSHSSQTWLPSFCNSYSLRDHLVWICLLLWLIFCIFHLKTKDLFHFCEVNPCCKSENLPSLNQSLITT